MVKSYRRGGKRYIKKKMKIKQKSHWPQTLSSVGNMAASAFSIASGVAALLNVEQKYHDTTGLATPGVTTPFLVPLALIGQGIDNTQRIGRSIKVSYLNIKYNYFANAAVTNQWLRVMVVQDLKHANAIFPATELLTINNELGMRNVDFGNKFKVLYDKTHYMLNTGYKSGGHVDLYIKGDRLANSHIEYDGTGAAISDISAFPIYICFFSSSPAGTPTSANYNCRLRFIDN